MNLNQKLLAFLCVCCFPCFSSAQNRTCSSPEVLENMLKTEPDMQERINNFERQAQSYIQRSPSVSERTVVNIPVVVHVIYNAAAENISDAQVQSQIDVLNRDFRKQNAEASAIPSIFYNIAADVEINFCLARITPDTNATNGIDRFRTSKTSWTSNDDMKRPLKGGVAPWDASRYLNIWVCNLSSGTLGYASFPSSNLSVDGVVIDYRYFGTINTRSPFNLGRTTTHEVGHWLGLFHIWGDSRCGDDHVADTPLHHGANFGCPAVPSYNTACGNNTVEMTMNFMDYTNDACMSMFTNGQKVRMRSLFVPGGARYGFVESNLCGSEVTPSVCLVPTDISSSNVTEASATIAWANMAGARTYTIQYKANSETTWKTINNISDNTLRINSLNSLTIYNVRVQTQCTNGGGSAFSNVFNFTTNAKVILPPPCSDNFEPNNTRSTAQLIETNRTEKAFIGYANDRDWYYFKAEAGTNCTIRLSNLPADYDIKLYDSKMRLLKSSENMGTADEVISYTATQRDSFILVAYGYNSAFDADRCYSFFIGTIAIAVINPTQTMANSENQNLYNSNAVSQGLRTEGGLKVFPNPATDEITLQILPELESDATVTLMNLSGQVILTEKRWVSKYENSINMDLSKISSGLYIISVKQGSQLWTQKLVKK